MDKILVKTITVSSKGQISIPKEMKEESNIRTGDTLLLTRRADEIVISKAARFYIPTITDIRSKAVPILKRYKTRRSHCSAHSPDQKPMQTVT